MKYRLIVTKEQIADWFIQCQDVMTNNQLDSYNTCNWDEFVECTKYHKFEERSKIEDWFEKIDFEMDLAYAKVIKGLLILNGYSENQIIGCLKSYGLDEFIEIFKNVSFDDTNPDYSEKLKSNNRVEEKMKEVRVSYTKL